MIFELLSNPIILYGAVFSIIIFLILYMWRKLTGLESYVFILEKRLNNVKKNNMNKEVINNIKEKEKESMIDADIIMNEVFNSVCLPTNSSCSIKNYPKYENSTSFVTLPVVDHTTERKEELYIPDEIKEHLEEKTKLQKELPVELPVVLPVVLPEELSVKLPEVLSSGLPEELSNVRKEEDDLESETTKSDILKTITISGKKLLKLDLGTLKDYCVKLNVSSEGTKNQIIERLLIKTQ